MKTLYNLYNKIYFENGIKYKVSLYENYRWLPDLTIPFCKSIIKELKIKDTETILDFGCAKGYMVKSFRLLQKKSWGVDISKYAIEQSDKETKQFLKLIQNVTDISKEYDYIIAKDTLEHIFYEEIDNVIKHLRNKCKKMFIIVPLGKNNKYIIPQYDLDITHIIKENMNWWENKFTKHKFNVEKKSYNIKNMKQKWQKWEKGNGFFILN